jgi:hypothetical protein
VTQTGGVLEYGSPPAIPAAPQHRKLLWRVSRHVSLPPATSCVVAGGSRCTGTEGPVVSPGVQHPHTAAKATSIGHAKTALRRAGQLSSWTAFPILKSTRSAPNSSAYCIF